MQRLTNRPAFDAGLAAYRRGLSVLDVAIKMDDDMERASHQDADHWAIESESKSFTLGFVSGIVEDIRKIAGSTPRGGLRA